MPHQKTKPKSPCQCSGQGTWRFDVTDLTPNQRRRLFVDCISQSGFVGFVKSEDKVQTCYTFKYDNADIR